MSLPEPIDLLSSEDEEKAVPPTAMTLPPIVLSSGACKPLANAEEEAQQGALQIVVIDVDAGDDNGAIDLTGDDDDLALSLQRRFFGGAHASQPVDLAGLHAERQARLAEAAVNDEATDAGAADLLSNERRKLQSVLSREASGLEVTETWHNPHSKPGCRLYERFIRAWQKLPSKLVRMVFHGTREANIDSICREGLDPKRRAGQALGPGEYFGEQAWTSLGYCQGGRKMLVFLVLLDPSGVTATGRGVTVIHKPEHQLPIAVITFRKGILDYSHASSVLSTPARFPGEGHRLGGSGSAHSAAYSQAAPPQWPVLQLNHPLQQARHERRSAGGGKRLGEDHHTYLMRLAKCSRRIANGQP